MLKSYRIDLNGAIASLVLICLGAFVAIEAYGYSLGTARRMNAGFYPFMLGLGMVLIGVAIFATEGVKKSSVEKVAVESAEHNDSSKAGWRPMILIPMSIGVFAVFIDSVGLIWAVSGLVVIAGLAIKRPAWKQLLLLSVLTPLGVWLVFVVGLRLPFKLL